MKNIEPEYSEKINCYNFSLIREFLAQDLNVSVEEFNKIYLNHWFEIHKSAHYDKIDNVLFLNSISWCYLENEEFNKLKKSVQKLNKFLTFSDSESKTKIYIKYELDDFFKYKRERKPNELTAKEFAGFISFFDLIGLNLDDYFYIKLKKKPFFDIQDNEEDDEHIYEILLNCNDFFFWACTDAEPFCRGDLESLKETYKECKKLLTKDNLYQFLYVWVCRKVGMRPQGAYYKYLDKNIHDLINQAGEEREIDFGNPQSEKGEYKYVNQTNEKAK